MTPGEAARMVAAQIGALCSIAALAGGEVRYVKLHGALGNLAADDRALAEATVAAVAALPGQLAILAISGTALELAALRLTTSITPATSGAVNPYVGLLQPVVEPLIPANRWYLFAEIPVFY